MPKIPTFTSQARPTAETSGVISNIKIPLNQTVGAALRPLGKGIEDYYVKEKEISNKVEAGELIANANQELLELQEKSKLESTPDKGMNVFNLGYKTIVEKYKLKASNSFVKNLFVLQTLSNKPSYDNSILKKTRSNMIETRVNQVNSLVTNKIAKAVEDENTFDISTLFSFVKGFPCQEGGKFN